MLDVDLKNLEAPFLVHSDIFKTFRHIKSAFLQSDKKISQLELHFHLLNETFGINNLIFPSFNYDFTKTKKFDIQRTPSQIGPLTNYILENELLNRTHTPVFSFLTNMIDITGGYQRPFSAGSVFDFIDSNNGTIVFYGTGIPSGTYLHYIEDRYGPPLYRYDKTFSGSVVDLDSSADCSVEFHVRPMGLALDYDWDFLFQLLVDNGCIIELFKNCFAIRARALSQIWGSHFSVNQFDFLNGECRDKIRSIVERLGRRIALSDYEKPAGKQ